MCMWCSNSVILVVATLADAQHASLVDQKPFRYVLLDLELIYLSGWIVRSVLGQLGIYMLCIWFVGWFEINGDACAVCLWYLAPGDKLSAWPCRVVFFWLEMIQQKARPMHLVNLLAFTFFYFELYIHAGSYDLHLMPSFLSCWCGNLG
jgi:hypothetical protein